MSCIRSLFFVSHSSSHTAGFTLHIEHSVFSNAATSDVIVVKVSTATLKRPCFSQHGLFPFKCDLGSIVWLFHTRMISLSLAEVYRNGNIA